MFWCTRATNFSIYKTKMEGAGLKILGTGAKFKQVPCQKNCRVNRAIVFAAIFSQHWWEKFSSDCFVVIFCSSYFLNTLESDINSNTIYFSSAEVYFGPFSERTLTLT